jgi:RNase P/RNase MRP subunit p29
MRYVAMEEIVPLNECILFALAVVVMLILICWWRHVCLAASARAWRPRELRDAELVYAEKVFRAGSEIPIVAKLDRGYRNAKGVIILVELKTRHANRSYLSDVIELSAQRFAVQMKTGERVAEYGYVLIQRPGSKSKFPHRVNLLSTEELFAVARRREAILRGNAVARSACSQGLCDQCAFTQECKGPVAS